MATSNWRTNLVVVSSVIFTVMVGLLLSQFDYLELRLLPTAQPVVGNELIAEAANTPKTAIPHSTETPMPPATETAVPSLTPEEVVSVVQPPCDNPAGWGQYIVRPGDSLNTLALQNGTTTAIIREANCLQVDFVKPGMQIYLPTTPIQPPTCKIPAGWYLYTVQRGDTMYSLALSRGTKTYFIVNVNCLPNTSLMAGQKIYLPPLLLPPASPTAIIMPTVTETLTSTPVTVTPTLIASETPVVTAMPTLTVTLTITATSTATTTATITPTVDSSGTPTFTPTLQPTGAVTATVTVQSTETETATPQPVGSATSTMTPGPTRTSTAVSTPTATLMPTGTWTPLPTDTPVVVLTETAVPTDTPIP